MNITTIEAYNEIDEWGHGIGEVIELSRLSSNYDIHCFMESIGLKDYEMSKLEYYVLKEMVLDRDYNLSDEYGITVDTIHAHDEMGNIYICHYWHNHDEESAKYGVDSEWTIYGTSTFRQFIQEFIEFRVKYRNFGKYANETKQISDILHTFLNSINKQLLKVEETCHCDNCNKVIPKFKARKGGTWKVARGVGGYEDTDDMFTPNGKLYCSYECEKC
ncbi:MAG: hypothetical protein ACRCX2_10320 [Paraclostridium sp.]